MAVHHTTHYTTNQYNEALLDVEDGPFFIEPADGDNFRLFCKTADLITYGDYEHVTKRAYQILKENGLHYYLIDQPIFADGEA